MVETDSLAGAILLVLVLLLALPMLAMAFATPMMGGHTWAWNDGTGVGWLWFVTWLVPLGVLLGVGYLLYAALTRQNSRGRDDPALEELRLAYARGDISSEEFEERRTRLERSE